MPSGEAVIGIQAWIDSMEGLTYSQQKNVFARCLRKAMNLIAERMRQLSPNDPRTPGSRIAKSITTAVREQTATSMYAEGGPTNHGFAAIMAERGTIKQPATPFLAPAFDQTIDQALALFDEAMGEAVEKEFLKRK